MNNQLNIDEYIKIELAENGDVLSVSNDMEGFLPSDKGSIWRDKKVKNQLLAKSYRRIKDKKKHRFKISSIAINRIQDCAGVLAFKVSPEKRVLHQAFFCKNRFCPICAWRASLKLSNDNRIILNNYLQEANSRLVFLTLTIKNCEAKDLRATIARLNYGWKKIRNRNMYKNNFYGDIKSVEITVNKENLTFHPHLHLILAAKESYFLKSNPYYITTESWASVWAEAIGEYRSIVDVRAVKKDNVEKANLEISKYIVKDSDYLKFHEVGDKVILDEELTDFILFNLVNQTKNLRFISYSGT